MSGYVRCPCCNVPIPVTEEDVGLSVTCPRTRRLVPVRATDVRPAAKGSAPKKPPAAPDPKPTPKPAPEAPSAPAPPRAARSRAPLYIAGVIGLLAVGVIGGILVRREVSQRRDGNERSETAAPRAAQSTANPPSPKSAHIGPGPAAPPLGPGVAAPPAGAPPVVAPAPLSREDRIRLLARELKDPMPEKRINALEQLATFGADANIVGVEMIEAMRDKNPAVRDAAAEAFEKVNPKVQPHVFTIIRGMGKRFALQQLTRLRGNAKIAIPLLYYWMDNPNEFEDRSGSRKVGGRSLYDAVAMIDSADARFCKAVLEAISRRIGANDFEAAGERLWALDHLTEAGSPANDKVKALLTALDDGVMTVEVIRALEGVGREAAPALPALKKLKLSADDRIRAAAIHAIAKIE